MNLRSFFKNYFGYFDAISKYRKTRNIDSISYSGHTYDISNKHRLGYSEVQLVQTMIDGVNTLWKEDLELQKKHGM